MNIKKVIFTGGGSGGHVMPAITLIKFLTQNYKDIEVSYIGSKTGIEKDLISSLGNVPYKSIQTGKLRRYFSFQNGLDLFKVFFGLIQSLFFLIKNGRNSIIFSTGGFVSVPVVLAGSLLRIDIYVHEQTSKIGLANKIASRFAKKVFISFEESSKLFPKDKVIFSGYPVRNEFYKLELKNKFFKNVSFEFPSKPILLVLGGGNGSEFLNTIITDQLNEITEDYLVFHQVGMKHIDSFNSIKNPYYYPLGFLGEEIIDLMKSATKIISRSGAGTVAELIALNKSSVLVPLKIAQQNEQYHNAMEAQKKLGSLIVEEDDFKNANILETLKSVNELDKSDEIKESFNPCKLIWGHIIFE